MKKIAIVLIALICLMTQTAFAVPEIIETLVNPHNFSDVNSTDVEILYLAEKGIVQGRADMTVDSQAPLNRAEALTVYARMLGLEIDENASSPDCQFSDMEGDEWYAPYVITMCEEGMISGYPDGTFQASNQLNRAEAMKILTIGLGGESSAPYSNLPADVDPSHWYAPYADYVVGKNITPLFNGDFNGAYTYVRGDLFVNVYRSMRIAELGEEVYSTSLDPVVIDEIEGKDSNVDFEVTGTVEAAEAYFNSINIGLDEFIDLPTGLTYKEAAEKYWFQWRVALLGKISPEKEVNFQKMSANDDYPVEFFEYFGLDVADVNAVISEDEMGSVLTAIHEEVQSYDKEVEYMKIFLNTASSNKIEIEFDEAGGNSSGIDYRYFDEYAYSLDSDYWPELLETTEVENVIEIVEAGTQNQVALDSEGFDEDIIGYKGDLGKITEGKAKMVIWLDEDLDPEKEYTLKLNPILFHRYVKWGNEFYNGPFFDTEFLPASEFTFGGDSALEFVYGSQQEKTPDGIIVDFPKTWNKKWTMPLSATLYSGNRLLSVESGLTWEIVQGGGELVMDEEEMNYIASENDSQVILKVKYGNLEKTFEVDFQGHIEI
jgi:hypothetical protein